MTVTESACASASRKKIGTELSRRRTTMITPEQKEQLGHGQDARATLLQERGVEPLNLSVQDPKSCASASSATPASHPPRRKIDEFPIRRVDLAKVNFRPKVVHSSANSAVCCSTLKSFFLLPCRRCEVIYIRSR